MDMPAAETPKDAAELAGYIEIWREAIADFLALIEQVPEAEWTTPIDLPGWDVKACIAHIAHLESVLAGNAEVSTEIGEPAHVMNPLGRFTEIGVVNRRDRSAAELIEEIRTTTAARHQALTAQPPTDARAPAVPMFAGLDWTWRTLLRNRALDVWMHEQDIRRAIGRPGNLDSAAARHTAAYLAEGFGYVLAKKVGAPAGTTAVLDLTGTGVFAVEIGADGRGRPIAVPQVPTVRLMADRESFILLAGGRRPPAPGAVVVSGDQELGAQILANLATTP